MDKELKILLIALVVTLIIFTSIKIKQEMDVKNAIKKALGEYPQEIVANAERILRLESANFTSGQFLGTYSAGMEPVGSTYPYGWNSLKDFWDSNPDYKPIGLKTYTEVATGLHKDFIQFPSVEASIMTLCYWLSLTDNNPGRWFSTETNLQDEYNAKIANIKAVYTDEV